MTEPIIRVEGLGKKYLLRHQAGGPRYRALRDVFADGIKSGFGLFRRTNSPPTREEFWALKDVNVEVNPGEVVGIIGRNGAGKSTLLKILSRITEPTTGRVTLNGRVASLLEVGTGFHPELTGRENIYLNGSILGMGRSEIARKFDEIVAFAEVEKFLDTPVKRYSSGMYVRLAFAVAAHLEPEILVVDEVLAVGDADFQKKCLGKMGEVARGGRTVLVVSHNMQSVSTLCTRACCLHQGELVFDGAVSDGIAKYYQVSTTTLDGQEPAARRPGTGEIRFGRVVPNREQFRPEEAKHFQFQYDSTVADPPKFTLSARLRDALGHVVCQCDSRYLGIHSAGKVAGTGELIVRTPWMKPGEYWLDLFLIGGEGAGVMDWYEEACRFQVLPILPYPHTAPESSISPSVVLAEYSWTVDASPFV